MQRTFADPMNLTQAPFSKTLILTEIQNSDLEIKLLELGFGLNSQCVILRKAPFNGPFTLKNKNTQIILRGEDAQLINVSLV